MKTKQILLLFILLSCKLLTAQTWQWAKSGGCSNNGNTVDELDDICTDANGNVYFVVNTAANAVLSGYSGYVNINSASGITLLASYRCDGTFRWKKAIGRAVAHASIGTDSLGHIYIAGRVWQPEVPTASIPIAQYDTDSIQPLSNPKWLYLAQYDTSGTLNWLRWPTPDSTLAPAASQSKYSLLDMCVGKDGSVDMICSLPHSQIGNATDGLYATDSAGVYVITYNKNGMLTRLANPDIFIGNTVLNNFRSVKKADGKYILSGNKLYSSAAVKDTMRIGDSLIRGYMFVSCFDENWQPLWIKNGTGVFYGRPIVDNAGNIYLGGAAGINATFNGYVFPHTGPLAVKLDESGNTLWLNTGKVQTTPLGSITGLSFGANGKLYHGGSLGGRLEWGNNFISAAGPNSGTDIFIAGFDGLSGVITSLDSLRSPFGFSEYINLSTNDKNGNVYVGGYFGGSLTVGNTTISKFAGSNDFFIAKSGTSNCGNVFPLKFLSFEGKRTNATNNLTWKTASESNIKNYEVQRSTNAQEFATISTVKAKNGEAQTYSYNDKIEFTGKLYYRIKITENDGKTEYSRIVTLNNNQQTTINIYPNPAKDNITIQLADNSLINTEAVIINAQGKTVLKQKIQSTNQLINISTLSQGTYFIKFENGEVEKVVVK